MSDTSVWTFTGRAVKGISKHENECVIEFIKAGESRKSVWDIEFQDTAAIRAMASINQYTVVSMSGVFGEKNLICTDFMIIKQAEPTKCLDYPIRKIKTKKGLEKVLSTSNPEAWQTNGKQS